MKRVLLTVIAHFVYFAPTVKRGQIALPALIVLNVLNVAALTVVIIVIALPALSVKIVLIFAQNVTTLSFVPIALNFNI